MREYARVRCHRNTEANDDVHTTRVAQTSPLLLPSSTTTYRVREYPRAVWTAPRRERKQSNGAALTDDDSRRPSRRRSNPTCPAPTVSTEACKLWRGRRRQLSDDGARSRSSSSSRRGGEDGRLTLLQRCVASIGCVVARRQLHCHCVPRTTRTYRPTTLHRRTPCVPLMARFAQCYLPT